MHSRQIAHNDIKLSNVLLDANANAPALGMGMGTAGVGVGVATMAGVAAERLPSRTSPPPLPLFDAYLADFDRAIFTAPSDFDPSDGFVQGQVRWRYASLCGCKR